MSENIPPELVSNILARLPVDDVVRCTSVCKAWYSIITCSSFISSHLNLSSANRDPRLLIRYYKYDNIPWRRSSYCLHRDNQTFDEIEELGFPFTGNWLVMDCLNGLCCLHNMDQGTVMLWNPSLRKSFILPKPMLLYDHRVYSDCTIGFAYVPASKEYKVFRSYCEVDAEPKAEIYQLSTGSWHDIKVEGYSYASENYRQAHLNGVLHWYSCNLGSSDRTVSVGICSLDMGSEKFGAMMVPDCLRNAEFFSLSTFKESLCLMQFDSNNYCCVWVMKEYGVAESWQKLFTFDVEKHCFKRFWHFRTNGELLCSKFYIEGNRKVELVSYDCSSDQVKNVCLLSPCSSFFYVYPYVESLALLKNPDKAKIDEEPAKIFKNT